MKCRWLFSLFASFEGSLFAENRTPSPIIPPVGMNEPMDCSLGLDSLIASTICETDLQIVLYP